MIGAVDIGGTKIAVATVQECGRINERAEWPTGETPTPEAAVRRMVDFFLSYGGAAGGALCGVGIGCTGPVDPFTGVVGNVDLLPGWNGFPIAHRLASAIARPVAVENDADAAALAEATWGAGVGARRFIYVTISTGIGAGLVFGGRLYRGVDGSHPELGHHTVDSTGPSCYCGATGCWESLASGPAMVEWVRANAGEDHPIQTGLSALKVCELAREGHALARKAVQRQGEYLGIGLANLITIFCPDIIALGGGVMSSGELFLPHARDVVRARCGLVPFEKTRITPAVLGRNAGLLGAARVWQMRFQESGVETSAS